MDQRHPIFDATLRGMVEFQRRPPSKWERIRSRGLSPNNLDSSFCDCSTMGEVLYLEKPY